MTAVNKVTFSSSLNICFLFTLLLLFIIKIARIDFNQNNGHNILVQKNYLTPKISQKHKNHKTVDGQSTKKQHFSDIQLLFQYNWTPLRKKVLQDFLDKWTTVATRIIIAIPTPVSKELYQVEDEFVKIMPYKGDEGFVTPLKNLAMAIDQLKTEEYFSSISGILQLRLGVARVFVERKRSS